MKFCSNLVVFTLISAQIFCVPFAPRAYATQNDSNEESQAGQNQQVHQGRVGRRVSFFDDQYHAAQNHGDHEGGGAQEAGQQLRQPLLQGMHSNLQGRLESIPEESEVVDTDLTGSADLELGHPQLQLVDLTETLDEYSEVSCLRCEGSGCTRVGWNTCKITGAVIVMVGLDVLTKLKRDQLVDHLLPESPKPWDHLFVTDRLFYDKLTDEFLEGQSDFTGPNLALVFDSLVTPAILIANRRLDHPAFLAVFCGAMGFFAATYFISSIAPIAEFGTTLDAMDIDPILINKQVGIDFFGARKKEAEHVVILVGARLAVGMASIWFILKELGFRSPAHWARVPVNSQQALP